MGPKHEGDPRIDRNVFSETLARELANAEAGRLEKDQETAKNYWRVQLNSVSENNGYSHNLGALLTAGVKSGLDLESVLTMFLTVSEINYGQGSDGDVLIKSQRQQRAVSLQLHALRAQKQKPSVEQR